MDFKKRKLLKITSVFVVIEAVFLYYIVGLFFFNPYPKAQFKYLPGIGYLTKTFFPLFWHDLYHPTGSIMSAGQRALLGGQFVGFEHFIVALWYGLVVAAIITAIVYYLILRKWQRIRIMGERNLPNSV